MYCIHNEKSHAHTFSYKIQEILDTFHVLYFNYKHMSINLRNNHLQIKNEGETSESKKNVGEKHRGNSLNSKKPD